MYDIVELVLQSLEEENVAEDLHDSEKWCFSAGTVLSLPWMQAVEKISLDESLCQVGPGCLKHVC